MMKWCGRLCYWAPERKAQALGACQPQWVGSPGSHGCAGRRYPTLPVAELQRHQAPVNALAWAPHSSCHICSAGDDAQALIWDLSTMSHPMDHGLGAAHCPILFHIHCTLANTIVCFRDGCRRLFLAAADSLHCQTAAHNLTADKNILYCAMT